MGSHLPLDSPQRLTRYLIHKGTQVAWSESNKWILHPLPHPTPQHTHSHALHPSSPSLSCMHHLHSPFLQMGNPWVICNSSRPVFPTCNQSLCPVSSNSESSLTSVPSFPSHCHPLISDSPSLWLGVGNLIGLSASCSLASLKHPTSCGQSGCPLRGTKPKSPWMNYRPCPNCLLPGCLHSYKTFSLSYVLQNYVIPCSLKMLSIPFAPIDFSM